jgi:hypothetical protein
MSISVGGTRSAAGQLAGALEPVAGQVHFSPECNVEYAKLGFDPSPGMVGRTQVPDRAAYLTSRGSGLGQVPGEVVAAAFGVFNPDTVIPAVTHGWTLTDAVTIREARERGAVAQLRRILGDTKAQYGRAADLILRAMEPLRLEGKPLFAGRRSLPLPEEPLHRMWRAADTLREYRGDSHILAWVGAGLDPVEVGLLGDVFWGLPLGAHTGGRGWTPEQLAEGAERLRSRGLLNADDLLTPAGFDLRAGIEADTDRHVAPALAVLGDDLAELVALLNPWGEQIKAAGGYLTPEVRFTWQG